MALDIDMLNSADFSSLKRNERVNALVEALHLSNLKKATLRNITDEHSEIDYEGVHSVAEFIYKLARKSDLEAQDALKTITGKNIGMFVGPGSDASNSKTALRRINSFIDNNRIGLRNYMIMGEGPGISNLDVFRRDLFDFSDDSEPHGTEAREMEEAYNGDGHVRVYFSIDDIANQVRIPVEIGDKELLYLGSMSAGGYPEDNKTVLQGRDADWKYFEKVIVPLSEEIFNITPEKRERTVGFHELTFESKVVSDWLKYALGFEKKNARKQFGSIKYNSLSERMQFTNGKSLIPYIAGLMAMTYVENEGGVITLHDKNRKRVLQQINCNSYSEGYQPDTLPNGHLEFDPVDTRNMLEYDFLPGHPLGAESRGLLINPHHAEKFA